MINKIKKAFEKKYYYKPVFDKIYAERHYYVYYGNIVGEAIVAIPRTEAEAIVKTDKLNQKLKELS